MITKKKTRLMILSVMILMMYLKMSDCVASRRQWGNRWDKRLNSDDDGPVYSARAQESKKTMSSPRTMSSQKLMGSSFPAAKTAPCPSSCTCRHRTVRCARGSSMVFGSMPDGVRHM